MAAGFVMLCTLLYAVRSRSVLQKERKDLCVYYRIDTTFIFPNGCLETSVSSSDFYEVN